MTTRHDDPPAWLHKIGVAVRRHPVLAAFTLMVLVVGVPVGNIVVQQAQIRAQNHRIQDSRVANSDSLCRALNDQALSTNGVNGYLQVIITGGAKQSLAFEPVYRRLGLPPYAARVEQAEATAKQLGELAVPHINCRHFRDQVRTNTSGKIPYEKPQFPKVPGLPALRTG